MRWLSRVVSILVIVAIVVAAGALVRSKMPSTRVGGGFLTYALFRDGSRLATSSPVMIAGVRVGEIRKLTVEGGFARIDMRLRDDVEIPVDSWITKKSESAFGDSYLEIIPGGDEGAPTARLLRSGEPIVHVQEGGSTDAVLRSIDRAIPKVDRGIDAIHDFALDGRKWANGTLQEAIISADRWLAEGHIDQPITAADRAVERAETATANAAASVASARPDVDRAFDRLDRGIANARTSMTDLKQSLREGFANAREGFDRIDPTVADLNEVITAVNEGKGDDAKGRLGRLVNDPGIADRIEDVTEAGRDLAGGLDRMKSWLGLQVEYDYFSRDTRIYATAEIRAHHDKFYLIEFEKGPLGDVPDDQLADSPTSGAFTREQVIHDGFRFTGQFGKTFGGWFQARAGIKDSTFGIGSDVLMMTGRLRLSTDLFGSFDRTPRLKVAAALEVFRAFYLVGGVDDALNRPRYLNVVSGATTVPLQFEQVRVGRDWFLGAALHFDDRDLAMMIRVYGALLVGLL